MARAKKLARKPKRKAPRKTKLGRVVAMWFVFDAQGRPVAGFRADCDGKVAALDFLTNPSPYPKQGFRAALIESQTVTRAARQATSAAKGK